MHEEKSWHWRDYLVHTVRHRQGIVSKEQARKVQTDGTGPEALAHSLAKHLECLTHSECLSSYQSGTSLCIYQAYLSLRKESAIFKLTTASRGPHSRSLNIAFRTWKQAPANQKEPRTALFLTVAHPRIDNWYIRRPSISSFGSDPSVGESLALEDTPRVSPKPTPFPSIYQRIYEETAIRKQTMSSRNQREENQPAEAYQSLKEERKSRDLKEESSSFAALLAKRSGKKPVHIRTQLRRPEENSTSGEVTEEKTVQQQLSLSRPPNSITNTSKTRAVSPANPGKKREIRPASSASRPKSQPRKAEPRRGFPS